MLSSNNFVSSYTANKIKRVVNECWSIGDNSSGQQGNNSIIPISNLTKMRSLPSDINIDNIITTGYGSTNFVCNNNQTLICCGYNVYGQLGIQNELIQKFLTYWSEIDSIIASDIMNIIYAYYTDTKYESNQLYPIDVDIPIQLISAGISSYHRLLLTKNNSLFGYGWNDHRQLIHIKNKWNYTEIKYFNEKNIKLKQIECTPKYTTFLTEEGRVLVCGTSKKGGLGIDDTSNTNGNIHQILPNKDFEGIKVIDITCGGQHTIAITSDHSLLAWGYNYYGQLGFGDTECAQCHRIYHRNPMYVSKPQILTYFQNHKEDIKVIKVSCGENHTLFLSENGRVYGCGKNFYYQLGDGTTKHSHSPKLIDIVQDKRIIDIKCGYDHSIAKDEDNNYYLWGLNDYNQCLVYNRERCVKVPTLYDPWQDFEGVDCDIVDMYAGWKETRVVIVVNSNEEVVTNEDNDDGNGVLSILRDDDSNKPLQPILLKSPRNTMKEEMNIVFGQEFDGHVVMAMSGDDNDDGNVDEEDEHVQFKKDHMFKQYLSAKK